MNKTHHFKHDSKMSIQEGALKEHKHSPIVSNTMQRTTLMRPFDAYAKLAIGRNVHRTIEPQISGDVALGFRSSNVSVDIFTPEVPDAMQRIKQRNKDKKNEAIK
jgi:hypothetical protein